MKEQTKKGEDIWIPKMNWREIPGQPLHWIWKVIGPEWNPEEGAAPGDIALEREKVDQ